MKWVAEALHDRFFEGGHSRCAARIRGASAELRVGRRDASLKDMAEGSGDRAFASSSPVHRLGDRDTMRGLGGDVQMSRQGTYLAVGGHNARSDIGLS